MATAQYGYRTIKCNRVTFNLKKAKKAGGVFLKNESESFYR